METSGSKTRLSLKLAQLIKITLLECFQKQILHLYFAFVLYLKKINNGTAFSSESGPTLKAGVVLRWLALLGPTNVGLVHTAEISAESNGLGKFPSAS